MTVSMFGPLTVIDGERTTSGRALGGAKLRDLLTILLLARGHAVSKDELAELLWNERLPKNVASTLEHYVCMLRNSLFCDSARARRVIVTEYNAYRFDNREESVDLDRFDDLLGRAEQASPTPRRELLEEAVGLAQGDLVEDSPYASWIQPHRDVYGSRAARTRLWLAQECVLAGDFRAAIRHSEDALRVLPFSEQAFRLIMVSDHALGHQDLARATYVRCRDLLADSLDVDATSETERVASAIDAGVPTIELIDEFVAPLCTSATSQPAVVTRRDRTVSRARRQNRGRFVVHRSVSAATVWMYLAGTLVAI